MSARPSKVDYKEFRDRYNDGFTTNALAVEFGISISYAQDICRRLHLESSTPRNSMIIENNKDLVTQMFKEGKTDKQISELIHASRTGVYAWRNRHGLRRREKRESLKTRCKVIEREMAELKGFVPDQEDKPWNDPESLFCSPKLQEIIGKDLKTEV